MSNTFNPTIIHLETIKMRLSCGAKLAQAYFTGKKAIHPERIHHSRQHAPLTYSRTYCPLSADIL